MLWRAVTSAHPLVARVVAAYLEEVDREVPGLVEGFYLTGSVALGEFRARTSDVDFVAVTGPPLGTTALDALARAHARLRTRLPHPHLDGMYATWVDLAQDPALRRGPHSHEGRFHAHARGPGDPVTWHVVAKHGVAFRGPAPAEVPIWTNAAVLAAWIQNNLDTYWRRLLHCAARPVDPWFVASHMAYGAVWIVLGTSRLHFTLATGDVCSKEAAGEYALRTFGDRWHRVVRESLFIRRADRARPRVGSALAEVVDHLRPRCCGGWGLHYATPFARRHDVLAFGEMVISDAERR